jgi:hypothetical protein
MFKSKKVYKKIIKKLGKKKDGRTNVSFCNGFFSPTSFDSAFFVSDQKKSSA